MYATEISHILDRMKFLSKRIESNRDRMLAAADRELLYQLAADVGADVMERDQLRAQLTAARKRRRA